MSEKNYEIYLGNDLGFTYCRDATAFRVWAPMAEAVTLNLYAEGTDGGDAGNSADSALRKNDLPRSVAMVKSDGGTWFLKVDGDLDGVYYTYTVTNAGVARETADPYARAAGLNGMRSMVVDLNRTNPEGYAGDHGPILKHATDAIICEISIRDLTGDPSCGAAYPGTYPGMTERGLTYPKQADPANTPAGVPTGLDYILDLGVTHVQIMPMYDFGSVDEGNPSDENYNWGYDPINYNVPEGSYSTNPADGAVRIKELKEMIASLHRHGIGIIMDVVYNHTYDIENSCFQKCVPDYFYRTNPDGSYSDASACGNEIASERTMVRKYIIDSVLYWMQEYHIDGFRFDLMGVLDMETMQAVSDAASSIRPDVLIYGEGWTGGDSVLPDHMRALKCNTRCMHGIGMFSDDIRDTLKGNVFDSEATGYINGSPETASELLCSIAGDVLWANDPSDTIHYMSCHDNLTLWDKLTLSAGKESEETRLAMNRLGAAIIMTAQGIPFFLCGEDFARSKTLPDGEISENSYNLPLSVNALDYRRLDTCRELHEYYKGLIAFRRDNALLRLPDAAAVSKALHFHPICDHVISYTLTGDAEQLFVVYNPNPYPVSVSLPDAGIWEVYIRDASAGTEILDKIQGSTSVSARSCLAAKIRISSLNS